MRRIIGICIGIVALALASAASAETIGGCDAKNYGNGVYYLNCSDAGPALAELRAKYPDSFITLTFYVSVVSGNTWARGYYVIVNPIPK